MINGVMCHDTPAMVMLTTPVLLWLMTQICAGWLLAGRYLLLYIATVHRRLQSGWLLPAGVTLGLLSQAK